jgi:hypothetical protein
MNSAEIIREVMLPMFRMAFDEILLRAIKQGKVNLKPSEVLLSRVDYFYVNGAFRWAPDEAVCDKLTKDVFDELEGAWKAFGLACN